jgi:hypothetical protein
VIFVKLIPVVGSGRFWSAASQFWSAAIYRRFWARKVSFFAALQAPFFPTYDLLSESGDKSPHSK